MSKSKIFLVKALSLYSIKGGKTERGGSASLKGLLSVSNFELGESFVVKVGLSFFSP